MPSAPVREVWVRWHDGCNSGGGMGETRTRQRRRCVRCGRIGYNAYRAVQGAGERDAWVCSHLDTCIARMRNRHRSDARRSGHRPATSPIAPVDLSEKLACVVGADGGSAERIERMLREYAACEVDRLDATRRALDRIAQRDYGLVVVDAQPGDSVAFTNELRRRLSTAHRRGVPILVCHSRDETGPAIETLISEALAQRVVRPFDAPSFMAAVDRAVHGVETPQLAV